MIPHPFTGERLGAVDLYDLYIGALRQSDHILAHVLIHAAHRAEDRWILCVLRGARCAHLIEVVRPIKGDAVPVAIPECNRVTERLPSTAGVRP